MKGKEDSPNACLPRAEKVHAYCLGASLDELEAENGVVFEENAWLDERSSAGGEEQAREYRGPLTPRTLYQALKKPVSCGEMRRLFPSLWLTCR
jgi:hypothetical protein